MSKGTPKMDWQQVALNGGPPCFALLDDEDGWYCGRAERWEGHNGDHVFVSLDAALAAAREAAWSDAIKIAKNFAQANVDNINAANTDAEITRWSYKLDTCQQIVRALEANAAAAHQTGEGK